MRYYVFSVQFNKDAKAENRTVPKAFDKREDAIKEFHRQMESDMGNATLGWSICMVINSAMGIEKMERWDAEVVETIYADDVADAF